MDQGVRPGSSPTGVMPWRRGAAGATSLVNQVSSFAQVTRSASSRGRSPPGSRSSFVGWHPFAGNTRHPTMEGMDAQRTEPSAAAGGRLHRSSRALHVSAWTGASFAPGFISAGGLYLVLAVCFLSAPISQALSAWERGETGTATPMSGTRLGGLPAPKLLRCMLAVHSLAGRNPPVNHRVFDARGAGQGDGLGRGSWVVAWIK